MTQNPSREQIVGLCEAVVSPGNVLYDRAERFVYGYDASEFRGTDSMAVVFPETAEQVSRIVRISHLAGPAVVARGAGTGINGGALPQGVR